MTVTVHLVDSDPRAQAGWDAYVDGHPEATPYHRRAWCTIFGEGLGYRSFLLLARNASGTPQGVLPLYLVDSPWRRRFVAVPFRDRGGPLWDSDEALECLIFHAKDLAREHRARSVVLKSLRPFPEATAQHQGLTRANYWIRSVMALGDLDEATLWKRVGAKNRNMIRQGRQHGLECRVSTGAPDAASRWHSLHLATQRRLGIPPFPRRFFESMLRELGPSGGVELLEVTRQEDLCAATLLLVHGDTCIYGYSASTEEGQRTRANDLMLFEAIKLALGKGLKHFDLGSDSPRQESLLFFKSKWGAIQAPIPIYTTGEDVAMSDSSQGRYALARTVLRRLPPALLDAVGRHLTRHLG